jgi:hypothetical protein
VVGHRTHKAKSGGLQIPPSVVSIFSLPEDSPEVRDSKRASIDALEVIRGWKLTVWPAEAAGWTWADTQDASE